MMSPTTPKSYDLIQEIVQETASITSGFVQALKVAQMVQQQGLSITVHETVLNVIERGSEQRTMERLV
jgi:hypothetical protein